jgi:hypothetical protein
MLDMLPDEILWNIVLRLDPIEEALTVLPQVCRAWAHALDTKRTRFWIGLAELHGISSPSMSSNRNNKRRQSLRSHNTAKRSFFERKRQFDEARRLEADRIVWELWKRLRTKDCVGWVRKRLATRLKMEEEQHYCNHYSLVHHAVRGLEHRTLLHLACWCGCPRTVRLLLEEQHGASIHVVDDWNATPMLIAAWAGHVAVVKLLLEHLLQQQQQVRKDEDLAEEETNGGNDNEKRQQTARRTKYYLNLQGVPPLTSSCGGRGPKTAICWAERKGFGSVVRLLERAGADTSHPSSWSLV